MAYCSTKSLPSCVVLMNRPDQESPDKTASRISFLLFFTISTCLLRELVTFLRLLVVLCTKNGFFFVGAMLVHLGPYIRQSGILIPLVGHPEQFLL